MNYNVIIIYNYCNCKTDTILMIFLYLDLLHLAIQYYASIYLIAHIKTYMD